MESVIISFCCFIFLFIITIVFFTKPKINKIENKIFSYLLILNIIELILDCSSYFMIRFIPDFYNTLSYILVIKFILCIYVLWEVFFVYYIVVISFSLGDDDKVTIKKNFVAALLTFGILIALFILISPIEIKMINGLYYPTGLSMLFLIVGVVYGIIIIMYCLIRNFKHLIDVRYLPLLFYVIFGSLAILWQISNPKFLLISPIESLVLFLMYFTIENPDMKLLEEVHNAKVISDNSNLEKTMFLYNLTSSLKDITKDIDYEANFIIDESLRNEPDLITIHDSAKEIKTNTLKFTTMTNEMMDVSQIDAANIKVYNEKYNIKLILKEIIALYDEKIRDKNLDFRTNIQSDLPEYLYGDSLNLKNVLISLLDNALEYTNKGYIEMTVDYIKKNDIARLIISVEDSGVGIKSTELKAMFNKNREEIDINNPKNNLYITNKLVVLMGGALIVSSTFGVGTAMKVVLDQKIDKIIKHDKYEKILDKKRILLVEDSDTTIKLISKYLKDSNVILEVVKLGSTALNKIRNYEKYDLILLEEDLKPLDAYTILRKLKLIDNFNTKVVLLTKNDTHEYSNEYKRHGFSYVLVKPIDKEKLLKIIKSKKNSNL